MKFLNISMFILVLFFTGALKAADQWVITLKRAFDQCKGPKLLTLERIGTLPLDCQRLIATIVPNPGLYQQRAAASARQAQKVQCMFAARTFN